MGRGGDALETLLLLAALAVLPFLLVMLTSFAKIAVVLHILRGALGTQNVPPTLVITGLSLVLTVFVMAPTGQRVYRAVEPALRQRGGAAPPLSAKGAGALLEAAGKAREPLREFLLQHSSQQDRELFVGLARQLRPGAPADAVSPRDLTVVAPAFAIGQLAEAFKIGFLLFIPFLVIELVVSSVLLALGLNLLAPGLIALPFKLLLFVMADGWALLARGLILPFGGS
jgi:type III secretion protein R